jgi:hypothetical protein
MPCLLSRFRVATASSARLVRIAIGAPIACVACLGSLDALGAEATPLPSAPASASAPPLAEALLRVKRRLVPFEVLQGRFEQEKRIAKIKRPLKSRGRFALLRGKGVLWRTEAPIQSLLTLTANAMSVVQNNQTVVSVSLTEQPALRWLGQTVFAVFMTDLEQLGQSFTLLEARVPEKPAPWSLSLEPRDAAVARLMRNILLTGGEHIESIEIAEQNGDSTRIVLLDPDSQSPLAVEDARQLGRTPGKP